MFSSLIRYKANCVFGISCLQGLHHVTKSPRTSQKLDTEAVMDWGHGKTFKASHWGWGEIGLTLQSGVGEMYQE